MRTDTLATSSNRQLAIDNWQWFCWQGWSLRVPSDWNAIKLEGNRENGFALLAGLESARLGIRWATPKKSSDLSRVVAESMRGEVGSLAAEESCDFVMADGAWSASRLYLEPEPPGRDVWIGVSKTSGRVVELIYHATRRDRVLAEKILPALADAPPDKPLRWSVLDVSCVTPGRFELISQQLSAGDLRLTFAHRRQHLLIRQIGPAELALARQPLEKWLAQHPLKHAKMYRSGDAIEIDGGLQRKFARRRRFWLYRQVPQSVVVTAMHDRLADRLVIVETDDDATAAEVMGNVGWARLASS